MQQSPDLDQEAVDQTEWENPANWSGPPWLSVYFSKKDSRIWVPKQIPALGWTVNLGRTGGVRWMIGIIVGVILLMAAVSIIAVAATAR